MYIIDIVTGGPILSWQPLGRLRLTGSFTIAENVQSGVTRESLFASSTVPSGSLVWPIKDNFRY